jgi:hypothetical protein
MQLAARKVAARPLVSLCIARPHASRLVSMRTGAVSEDASLSSGDQARFDKIAEALVAKLQDLPEGVDLEEAAALEDGEGEERRWRRQQQQVRAPPAAADGASSRTAKPAPAAMLERCMGLRRLH